MKTVLFQGDSITDCGRSREEEFDGGYGYAVMTKGELEYRYPGEYVCYNRGISGDRIVDIYARIKKDILNLKPDILSILVGVNDVGHEAYLENGVDDEKYFRVYCMLIEEIKAALPDIQILIMEPFVLKGEATEPKWEFFNTEVRKRAARARKVAEKYGLTFVPLQEKFDELCKVCPPEYWLLDGVHPSSAGHTMMKDAWIEAFKSLQ